MPTPSTRRFRPLAARALVCVALATASALAADGPELLRTLCFKCHAGEKVKGDLHLDRWTDRGSLAAKITARDLLASALGQMQRSEMPPAKASPQPDSAQRASLAAWLTAQIADLDRITPVQAGRVTMRRLNREEFRATIRDLIGIGFDRDFDPTRDFPADGAGHGFDNIGNVLTTSPLLLERALAAVEAILAKAVVVDGLGGPRTWTLAGKQLAFTPPTKAPGVPNPGRWSGQIEIRQEGDYRLRASVRPDAGTPKDAPLAWSIDFQDPQTGTKRGDQATGSAPSASGEITVKLARGSHDLAVFLHRETGKSGATPVAVVTGDLTVDAIEIQGPLGFTPDKLPASHRRIFIARPTTAGDRSTAAQQVLTAFARRAFRRPVTADEVARYLTLFTAADRDGESFEGAMLTPLAAILVAPSFLYRIEADRPLDAATGAYALDCHALAARLSYFLWSSMPDEELFRLADAGTLSDPAVIAAQVTRMLADPKAEALTRIFVPQWLQIGAVETFTPDHQQAGELGTNLRTAMMEEPVALFAHLLRANRSLLELLDADYSFINEDLAKLYEIPGIKDPEVKGRKDRTLVKATLPSGRRGGVLTMAAVLTATSYPDRTSAVRRGKFVLEAILGAAPPPPPPEVQPLIDAAKTDKAGKISLRQRLEQHRADATCASCHARMDPLGFGFENYNPLGKWRDKESNLAIDASGTLPDGRSFKGPSDLKKLLLERKDDFTRCLSEKLLTYALGRGLESFDRRSVAAIAAAAKAGDHRLSALITAICLSHPFRQRSGPEPAGPAALSTR